MTEYDRSQRAALRKVEEWAARLVAAERELAGAKRGRDEWITKAVDRGVSSADVARVAGVSTGRVSQLAPVPRTVSPRVHAQKDGDAAVCVTSEADVPRLPDTSSGTLSGYSSQRVRKPYGRRTAFYDTRTGELVAEDGTSTRAVWNEYGTVRHVLTAATAAGLFKGRVYLVGPSPLDTSAGATLAEAARAWGLGELPDGWSHGAHYLKRPDLPTFKYVDDAGRELVVMRAASWWGETAADAATCAAAWVGLGRALDAVRPFHGAGLADTPAATGRALWLRTIPEGQSFPVLSDELRELIHTTSGQGRIELRPEHPSAGPSVADFTYLDGRFMYAALTWGMPVGEPVLWTGGQLDALDARGQSNALRGRGRWRITCRVPSDWQHVGMFMAPHDGGGWCYPAEPGQTFTTWADGSEVWAAMERGWEPTIHEGITWAEGKPLNVWRDGLVSVWESARASASPAAELAARAVRSILLTAIGAFASRAQNRTGSVAADRPELVPAEAIPGSVSRVGDQLVYELPGKLDAWAAEAAHPEWSATIWARARTRLLTGRGVGQERVGALHLPADRIVAFATDALYIAGGDPGWSDDGQPGRFRVKGTRPGVFAWPTSNNELHQLRDDAERFAVSGAAGEGSNERISGGN